MSINCNYFRKIPKTLFNLIKICILDPSTNPTVSPTSSLPTNFPVLSPTFPTANPTALPSQGPNLYPTFSPFLMPTFLPTKSPTEYCVSLELQCENKFDGIYTMGPIIWHSEWYHTDENLKLINAIVPEWTGFGGKRWVSYLN